MPPFPHALDYLWRTYGRLRSRKAMGYAGPEPIQWIDMDAFVRRTGITLAPWEIELLEEIDNIYLSERTQAPVSADEISGKPPRDPDASNVNKTVIRKRG